MGRTTTIQTPQATTRRTATARSRIRLPPDVTSKMETVGGDVVGKKGPVFTTAIIAGVQAAKRTSELIPFCHPLPIEDCRVELSLKEGGKVSCGQRTHTVVFTFILARGLPRLFFNAL